MIRFSFPTLDSQFRQAIFSFGSGRSRFSGQWVTRERWESYYNQINEILKVAAPGDEVLEIGSSDGFTLSALRLMGLRASSIDSNPDTHPTTAGNIAELELPPSAYDIICSFQTLEHIAYEDFLKVLRRIHGSCRKYCLISLPLPGPEMRFSLRLPLFSKPLALGVKLFLPWLKTPKRELPEHQWELGRRDYPLERVRKDIAAAGFEIEKVFHQHSCLYFTFFVLKRVS